MTFSRLPAKLEWIAIAALLCLALSACDPTEDTGDSNTGSSSGGGTIAEQADSNTSDDSTAEDSGDTSGMEDDTDDDAAGDESEDNDSGSESGDDDEDAEADTDTSDDDSAEVIDTSGIDPMAVYKANNCTMCHNTDLSGSSLGPSIKGISEHWDSADEMVAFLKDPVVYALEDYRLKTENNEYTMPMPKIPEKDEAKIRALAEWLIEQ